MPNTLFFIAQQEVIGQDNGEDVYGYKLGPSSLTVELGRVVELEVVGANHLFMYPGASDALADQVKGWSEFRGLGYIDMAMRLLYGLSPVSQTELKYMTGAHWFTGGEWHFGNCHDWEAAGSPAQVKFGKLRDLLGVELH